MYAKESLFKQEYQTNSKKKVEDKSQIYVRYYITNDVKYLANLLKKKIYLNIKSVYAEFGFVFCYACCLHFFYN